MLNRDFFGKLIYLAAPYTHSDPHVRQLRVTECARFVAAMMEDNLAAGTYIAPLLLYHEPSIIGRLPMDFSFWQQHNYNLIRACDEMHILRLAGYEASRGVAAERYYAFDRGTPIREYEWSTYHNAYLEVSYAPGVR